MRNLFSNRFFIIVLVITVLLLLSMVFFSGQRDRVSFGERVIGTVVMPFQSAFTSIGKGVSGFFGHFADIDRLQQENEDLSSKVDELEGQVRSLEEFKVENERLRAMLDLKESDEEHQYVSASVIGRDAGNWYQSFTINKGTDDGLAVKQPVITSKGLVGSITEISGHWAKVSTIIDPESSIGAMVSRTEDVTMVDGDFDLAKDGLCKMVYVSKGANLTAGDIIETSGLGGIYPRGLLIGKIREVHPDTKGISQYAVVETAVEFDRISEVFVITD